MDYFIILFIVFLFCRCCCCCCHSINEEPQRNKKQTRASQKYTEDEVVELAIEKLGTVLWTNEGQVVINIPGSTHAEKLFISQNTNPYEITRIYIENSPCSACSAALRRHFSEQFYKPTILVGRIWHLQDSDDHEGLELLLKDGFDIQVWEKMHERRYPGDTKTKNYIRDLKQLIA